ncbi:MAG: hypothetical protein AB7F75_09245 [Planctomycetota bacterium]
MPRSLYPLMASYRLIRRALGGRVPDAWVNPMLDRLWREVGRNSLPTAESLDAPSPRRPLSTTDRFYISSVKELGIELYEELHREAEILAHKVESEPLPERQRRGKHYKIDLNGDMYANPPESIFTRYSLQPALLAIAKDYLGMTPRLHSTELHLDVPFEGESASAQNWHYDGLDHRLVKVFTYLRDVTPESGCLCVAENVPSTRERFRIIRDPRYHKRNDDRNSLVAERIPSHQIHPVRGPAGTVIVADTASLIHRGIKQISKARLMFVATYTSPLPYEEWPLSPFARLSPTSSRP